MKTSQTIMLLVGIVLIGLVAFVWSPKDNGDGTEQTSSIEGCYVATIGKDVYTLNVLSQEGENFEGTLRFKNFEKDSSSGTFVGTYKDEILLGEYAFQSEGTNSVIEAIFKKSGDDFVRGFGPLKEGGAHFADISQITYNASSPLSLFRKASCPDL